MKCEYSRFCLKYNISIVRNSHQLYQNNSKCNCNETPPMTGWTLDFFTCTIHKFSKVVYEKTGAFKTSVCCMKIMHFLRIYNKPVLCEHDCFKFRKHISWHSFLANNFAEFLDEVQVIKIKISSSFWWHFVTATSAIATHHFHLSLQRQSFPIQQLILFECLDYM